MLKELICLAKGGELLHITKKSTSKRIFHKYEQQFSIGQVYDPVGATERECLLFSSKIVPANTEIDGIIKHFRKINKGGHAKVVHQLIADYYCC